MTTEATVLAHVMNKTRDLTQLYLGILSDVDLHKSFEVDGKKFNNVFWIMAHLPVIENYLLLRSIGGEPLKIPWARQFGLGSVLSEKEDSPPVSEVKEVMEEVHSRAIKHIEGLSDSFLNEPGTTSFEFFGEKSVRSIIVHAIRHEGTHAGHLGWLCKLHGIKTF
jgi:hypothetical protein